MHSKLFLISALLVFEASRGDAAAQERRILEPLLPDARTDGSEWHYSTEVPPEGWQEAGFDDASWSTAVGGFGNGTVENGVIRTAWVSQDIWMRRTFSAPSGPGGQGGRFEDLILSLHHDDDAEVWVNGVQVALEPGFATAYGETFLPSEVVSGLKPVGNVIALHCANAGSGPQYADAGLFGARTVAVSALSPDARIAASTWRFTTLDPGPGWEGPDFDPSSWSEGPGGFGSKDLYADHVGSEWLVDEIWMRRSFTSEKEFAEYQVTFQHDDDMEVYLNGRGVLQRSGWATGYREVLLTAEEAGVRKGENVLAVHCRNIGTGPQFVDVGLLGLEGKEVTRAGRAPAPKRIRSGAGKDAGRVGRLGWFTGRSIGMAGRMEIVRPDGKRIRIAP